MHHGQDQEGGGMDLLLRHLAPDDQVCLQNFKEYTQPLMGIWCLCFFHDIMNKYVFNSTNWGSGCCTAVELTPGNLNAVGLIPAECWAFSVDVK